MVLRNVLIAIIATVICNCVHLSSSFLSHSTTTLSAGEALLVRAIVQIFVFAIWSGIHHQQNGWTKIKHISWFWAASASLILALITLMCYLGVKMMPVSDFIVVGFTSPVFTLILSAIILRYHDSQTDIEMVFRLTFYLN